MVFGKKFTAIVVLVLLIRFFLSLWILSRVFFFAFGFLQFEYGKSHVIFVVFILLDNSKVPGFVLMCLPLTLVSSLSLLLQVFIVPFLFLLITHMLHHLKLSFSS